MVGSLAEADIVRQLDELLRQNTNLTPSVVADARRVAAQPSKSKWGTIWTTVQSVLRERPAKNISLFLVSPFSALTHDM